MSNIILEKLQSILKQKQIHALIIPTSDPHKSEYIENYWKTREYLTGFLGSAGTAVITANHAGLWTDSRYFVQAETQMFQPFVLHKLKTRQPEYIDWLVDNLNYGDTVGIDTQLFSVSEIEYFENKFESKSISVIPIVDLFSDIWIERPELSKELIYIHDDKFTDLTRVQKIDKVRRYIKSNKIEQILISALDDIAWLLNLRGADIKYNPVFSSYVLINKDDTILFIDELKIELNVRVELNQDGIDFLPYSHIENYLKSNYNFANIEVDTNTINYRLIQAIHNNCIVKYESSIVGKMKSVKGEIEINHYKNAQIRDGLAMCNLLHWLDERIMTESVTEVEVAEMSEKFRSVQDNYIGLSFGVISAFQENAALPHYSFNTENPVYLKPKGLYLIDSGAQYLDGTTDITRTVALGEVSKEQKTDFTLVLKGHIRLATAKFPYGTKGFHLDTLSRLDLWSHGKDFGHGTGHGIGYFLNVHEGPQGFSQMHQGAASTVIEPGMFITNEPGFYLEGKYGIRIENVLVCIEDRSISSDNFLSFETVTYCPIDKNLIDIKLLTETEINWINSYHKQVYELISPLACSVVIDWLKEKTTPL